MGLDPISALAGTVGDIINGWRKENHIQQWLKLIFECVASMVGSFLIVCGVSLTSGASVTFSIGSGMITMGVVLFIILRRNDLTKGMLFVAPGKEAEIEINTDVDIIQRAK